METPAVNNVLALPPAYYERLGSSLEEKLFFLDRIPKDVTVFADFGCGDGRLLANVAERRANVHFTLGYDRNADVLRTNSPTSHWTPSLATFEARIQALRKQGHKVCLILSSVVHEVLSQGLSWFKFWAMIRGLGCDFVAIRDMACSIDAKSDTSQRGHEAAIRTGLLDDILLYGTEGTFEFQNRADFLQALLKYRYTENLHAELAEDYFALSSEQWLNLTNVGSGYTVQHFDHHSVPWHRENWKRDFGLDIEDPTHIKIILKKV